LFQADRNNVHTREGTTVLLEEWSNSRVAAAANITAYSNS